MFYFFILSMCSMKILIFGFNFVYFMCFCVGMFPLQYLDDSECQNNTITDFEEKAHNGIIADFTGSAHLSETGKFRDNSKDGNSAIFRDFSQENSALRIYDIWNFSKVTKRQTEY
jgi:hypothetical protein